MKPPIQICKMGSVDRYTIVNAVMGVVWIIFTMVYFHEVNKVRRQHRDFARVGVHQVGPSSPDLKPVSHSSGFPLIFHLLFV